MKFRQCVALIVALSSITVAFAAERTADDERRERWLTERMNMAYEIKPGALVSTLSKNFHHASAFANPNGTYVYFIRDCPLIRIDVTFAEVTQSNWTTIVDDKWTIKTVSKPYLEPVPRD